MRSTYAKFDTVKPGDKVRRRRMMFRVVKKIEYTGGGGYLELKSSEGPTVWSSVDFDRRRFLVVKEV